MRQIDAFIFDLDGVVVSTDAYHTQAWKAAAAAKGIAFDQALGHRLRGVSRLDSAELIFQSAGYHGEQAELERFAEDKNACYLKLLENLSPKDILPGVERLLEAIRDAGLKTAIASSSKNAQLILKKIGLDTGFDTVVDGTMVSRAKPDPELFVKAADRLMVLPAHCVVLEDAIAGIEGARACGMCTLAVGPAASQKAGDLNYKSLEGIMLEIILNMINSQ